MILLASAVALIIMFSARKPAWVVLLIAGLGTATTSETFPDLFGYELLNLADTVVARLVIAAGLAGWALGNRSWRVGVVAVVLAALPLVTDREFLLALVPLAAAALAAGPRRNPWYAAAIAVGTVALVPVVTPFSVDSWFIWVDPAVPFYVSTIGLTVVGAVVLATAAPRPAWAGLVIGALAAIAARSVIFGVPVRYDEYESCPRLGFCGSEPGWYTGQPSLGVDERHAEVTITVTTLDSVPMNNGGLFGTAHAYGPTLPFDPQWVIVAGLLAWAIRRRSWRVAVTAALYGIAVPTIGVSAPVVLLLAAAAAAGARKDVHYLAGIGLLALAVSHDDRLWQLIVTVVALLVALGLGIWAFMRKNGANGAVAIATMVLAPLTPFLSAGVLLATAFYRSRTTDQANG